MGRWSNERRKQEAEKAAKAASETAAKVQAEPVSIEQTDSDKVDAPRPKPRNPYRQSAMAEIEERHNRTSGNVETPEQTVEVTVSEEPKQEPEAKKVEVSAEPAVEPVAQEAQPEPKQVKVKVDGEEYNVPEAEIEEYGGVRAYQVAKAAENRLKRANDALAESKRIAAYMAQQLQASAKPQEPQVTREQWKQVLFHPDATPEQKQQAYDALQAMDRVDPVAVENRAVFKTNQVASAARFKQEFSDIASNPNLMQYAGWIENQRLPRALQEAGIMSMSDPRLALFDFDTFYRSIGNEIRGSFPRQSQPQQAAQTAGTPSPASEKEARKASIVTLPTAAATRAQLPQEEQPETREQVLNNIRKARGLPVG